MGQIFGVAGEAAAAIDQLARQVGLISEILGARVIGNAEGRTRQQRDVIGLAGMPLSVRVNEVSPRVRKRGEVGSRRAADDLLVGLVLKDDNQRVIRSG